jgi:hypothetical protein
MTRMVTLWEGALSVGLQRPSEFIAAKLILPRGMEGTMALEYQAMQSVPNAARPNHCSAELAPKNPFRSCKRRTRRVTFPRYGI